MRLALAGLVWGALFLQNSFAATRIHVIAFGKSMSVPWIADTSLANDKPLFIKVRALIVDGQLKEYVLGTAHEVTDRLFVMRRAFRINDSLPGDPAPRWQWQRGGWLLVDRISGRVSALALPEFDSFHSAASWYRDYVAYCGVTEDGKKIDAIVAQIGRRKPILKKVLSDDGVKDDAMPDSACSIPTWQRDPTRVNFEGAGGQKQAFVIRGQVVDLVNDADEDGDAR